MRGELERPAFLLPGSAPWFPDPDSADEEGLVAIGGDLSVERLLHAYEAGLFPWYDVGIPPLWWSPDPRAVLDIESLHVSRSMQRELGRGRFALTWNRAFSDVLRECAHRPESGTWILPDMIAAYTELHQGGHAHSVEVWRGEALVGGLYGVQRGALFAAESMFHRETNASKIALIVAVRSLFRAGIELFDVQFSTPHLASLGATTIARKEYLARLRRAAGREISLGALSLEY